MSSIENIARSIVELAHPGMKPAALLKAVRAQHPEATKKRVRSAAFYAVILACEGEPGKLAELHDLALRARVDGRDDD